MRVLIGLLLCLSGPAQAHLPNFSEVQHSIRDTAWTVEDIDLSIVLYHEVTCDTELLWLQFDGQAGEELFFQLGVPVIDALVDHRPSIALVAPGLPTHDGELPFALPEGYGARVFESRDMLEATAFFEPITQTQSWIWIEERFNLPEGGEGFLVAWNPERTTSKLWVAVGETEDFSGADINEFSGWLEKTRRFHETAQYEGADPITTIRCAPLMERRDDQAASGCSVTTQTRNPAAILLLTLVACAGLRRRHSKRS